MWILILTRGYIFHYKEECDLISHSIMSVYTNSEII